MCFDRDHEVRRGELADDASVRALRGEDRPRSEMPRMTLHLRTRHSKPPVLNCTTRSHDAMPHHTWRHYLSNATCASFVIFALRRVNVHYKLLHCSPLLKNTCVRQVVLGKRFPLIIPHRYLTSQERSRHAEGASHSDAKDERVVDGGGQNIWGENLPETRGPA